MSQEEKSSFLQSNVDGNENSPAESATTTGKKKKKSFGETLKRRSSSILSRKDKNETSNGPGDRDSLNLPPGDSQLLDGNNGLVPLQPLATPITSLIIEEEGDTATPLPKPMTDAETAENVGGLSGSSGGRCASERSEAQVAASGNSASPKTDPNWMRKRNSPSNRSRQQGKSAKLDHSIPTIELDPCPMKFDSSPDLFQSNSESELDLFVEKMRPPPKELLEMFGLDKKRQELSKFDGDRVDIYMGFTGTCFLLNDVSTKLAEVSKKIDTISGQSSGRDRGTPQKPERTMMELVDAIKRELESQWSDRLEAQLELLRGKHDLEKRMLEAEKNKLVDIVADQAKLISKMQEEQKTASDTSQRLLREYQHGGSSNYISNQDQLVQMRLGRAWNVVNSAKRKNQYHGKMYVLSRDSNKVRAFARQPMLAVNNEPKNPLATTSTQYKRDYSVFLGPEETFENVVSQENRRMESLLHQSAPGDFPSEIFGQKGAAEKVSLPTRSRTTGVNPEKPKTNAQGSGAGVPMGRPAFRAPSLGTRTVTPTAKTAPTRPDTTKMQLKIFLDPSHDFSSLYIVDTKDSKWYPKLLKTCRKNLACKKCQQGDPLSTSIRVKELLLYPSYQKISSVPLVDMVGSRQDVIPVFCDSPYCFNSSEAGSCVPLDAGCYVGGKSKKTKPSKKKKSKKKKKKNKAEQEAKARRKKEKKRQRKEKKERKKLEKQNEKGGQKGTNLQYQRERSFGSSPLSKEGNSDYPSGSDRSDSLVGSAFSRLVKTRCKSCYGYSGPKKHPEQGRLVPENSASSLIGSNFSDYAKKASCFYETCCSAMRKKVVSQGLLEFCNSPACTDWDRLHCRKVVETPKTTTVTVTTSGPPTCAQTPAGCSNPKTPAPSCETKGSHCHTEVQSCCNKCHVLRNNDCFSKMMMTPPHYSPTKTEALMLFYKDFIAQVLKKLPARLATFKEISELSEFRDSKPETSVLVSSVQTFLTEDVPAENATEPPAMLEEASPMEKSLWGLVLVIVTENVDYSKIGGSTAGFMKQFVPKGGMKILFAVTNGLCCFLEGFVRDWLNLKENVDMILCTKIAIQNLSKSIRDKEQLKLLLESSLGKIHRTSLKNPSAGPKLAEEKGPKPEPDRLSVPELKSISADEARASMGVALGIKFEEIKAELTACENALEKMFNELRSIKAGETISYAAHLSHTESCVSNFPAFLLFMEELSMFIEVEGEKVDPFCQSVMQDCKAATASLVAEGRVRSCGSEESQPGALGTQAVGSKFSNAGFVGSNMGGHKMTGSAKQSFLKREATNDLTFYAETGFVTREGTCEDRYYRLAQPSVYEGLPDRSEASEAMDMLADAYEKNQERLTKKKIKEVEDGGESFYQYYDGLPDSFQPYSDDCFIVSAGLASRYDDVGTECNAEAAELLKELEERKCKISELQEKRESTTTTVTMTTTKGATDKG